MNKIKYALCIFITAAVTCAVIFLPYLYYSRTDKRDADNYVTETYSLETKSDKITSDELIKLLSSDEAIWLKSDTFSMYYYDDKLFDELFDELNAAQPQLKNAFKNNDLAKTAIDEFYKATSQTPANMVEEVTVNGEVNGSPVSITLLYAEYADSTENGLGRFSMLIDKNTKIVYEFNCTPKTPLVQDDFLAQHDLYESFELSMIEQTYSDLRTYWNINNEHKYNIVSTFDCFYFNIMPLTFTQYEFNNYNSIMYGYDESDNGYEISEKNKY